jgi:D-alanyl-D-alanine carboxypeptidase
MRSRLCCSSRLRVLAIILAALLFTLAPARATLGPALVFDVDTGEVLIEERAGEPWYPASLTKLMTAYLVFEALEAGKLQLDQLIPVSEAAAKLPPSKIGIPAGRNVTVDLALRSILIHSANDMSVVLAEAVSGNQIDFVAEMNETARKLDMHATRFANPHGLPDLRQVTTARDMGLLAGIILTRFPQSRAYFSAPNVDVGGVTLPNRNGLLRDMPAADGMKTGFICDSGFNLVASASFGERRLIAVVMGAKSAPSRNVLTRVLLESAQVLAQEPAVRPTLLDLTNAPAGTSQPRSLNQMVCQGIGRVSLEPADAPKDWGVSFGRYAFPLTAEAILTGRLLAIGNAAAGRSRGVVQDDLGYLALVWNMSMSDALALCAGLQRHNGPCEAMSPEAFARMAKELDSLAGTSPDPGPPQLEGSR